MKPIELLYRYLVRVCTLTNPLLVQVQLWLSYIYLSLWVRYDLYEASQLVWINVLRNVRYQDEWVNRFWIKNRFKTGFWETNCVSGKIWSAPVTILDKWSTQADSITYLERPHHHRRRLFSKTDNFILQQNLFKNGRPLFCLFYLFKQTLNFLQQINVKNVYTVYIASIRTHDLWNMSLLP